MNTEEIMVDKKTRFDFYKAVQSAQFHTQNLLERWTEGGVPDDEMDKVGDYLDQFIPTLIQVRERLKVPVEQA